LNAAMERIRQSAVADMPVIVVAHAFVTGGQPSESERDVRVGGIQDAPISIFDGADYVALGHLHRPQELTTQSQMKARYSGSPIAYSFSEEGQEKSVVILDVNDESIHVTLLPTPQPRALATIQGDLDELLSDSMLSPLENHWIRAIVTDERRPERPMDRLRERFPHTLQLEFAPAGGGANTGVRAVDISVLSPVEVTTSFIEYVSGTDVTETERALIEQAVERVRLDEVT
jgi:DNA repair protein SbcD/Mre11